MEKNEIIGFVREMKPKDHVILLYSNPEYKRVVLFTYIKAELDRAEAAAYVTMKSHLTKSGGRWWSSALT